MLIPYMLCHEMLRYKTRTIPNHMLNGLLCRAAPCCATKKKDHKMSERGRQRKEERRMATEGKREGSRRKQEERRAKRGESRDTREDIMIRMNDSTSGIEASQNHDAKEKRE